MKILEHPDIKDDLFLIAKDLKKAEIMLGFMLAYEKALKEIINAPCPNHNILKHNLNGWYKHKFHKTIKPVNKQNPEFRIIYQLSKCKNKLRVLAIGRRIDDELNQNQRTLDDGTIQQDVYNIAGVRSKSSSNNYQPK